MDRFELIRRVEELAAQGQISREELVGAWERGTGLVGGEAGNQQIAAADEHTEMVAKTKMSLSDVLYAIGALVVIVGISVLIGQRWDVLSSAMRMMVTLGFSLLLYAAGMVLFGDRRTGKLSQAFFTISCFLLPLGVYVSLHEMGASLVSLWLHVIVTGVLSSFYLVSYRITSQAQFLLFGIIFGTSSFVLLTEKLVDAGGDVRRYGREWYVNFGLYRTMLVGLSYALLGYVFSSVKERVLTPFFYFFGLLSFLGAAFGLSTKDDVTGMVWMVLFMFLVGGVIYLSVFLKNRIFLYLGSLYLLVFIFWITGKYFADSVGWAFALIVAGFGLIGVGYLTFWIQRRYIGRGRSKGSVAS